MQLLPNMNKNVYFIVGLRCFCSCCQGETSIASAVNNMTTNFSFTKQEAQYSTDLFHSYTDPTAATSVDWERERERERQL